MGPGYFWMGGMWIFPVIMIVVMLIVSCFFGGCTYLNKKVGLKDDNTIEEITEAYIFEHTGLDIDLSPNSPENP